MAVTMVESFPAFNLTGAVHHYIRTPATGEAIYYLGTCEVQPDVRIWELSLGVKNDMTGRILDGQKTDQGKRADIGLQLSRYSELAYTQVRLPRGTGTSLVVQDGWEGRFGRGSLVFGSKTFEMWQVFDRQTDVALRDANMAYGWYWPQVEMLQHAPVVLGNQEKQLLLVLEAQPRFVPQASYATVGMNERTFQLYRTDDAAFTGATLGNSLVLTPQ